MARITTAGASNWRAAFEGRPGLAVTPGNYERLLAQDAPEAAPEPEPAPRPPAPRRPPARPPAAAPGAAAAGD